MTLWAVLKQDDDDGTEQDPWFEIARVEAPSEQEAIALAPAERYPGPLIAIPVYVISAAMAVAGRVARVRR